MGTFGTEQATSVLCYYQGPAKTVKVENAGHYLLGETTCRPQQMVDAIIQFLDGLKLQCTHDKKKIRRLNLQYTIAFIFNS